VQARYQFKSGVVLVRGASRGAILDTNTGLVYSVNRQACEVCSYQVEDETYWETLFSMGIAEKTAEARPPQLPKANDTEHLKFIWLEITTSGCNQKCIHCYAESLPKAARNGGADGRSNRGTGEMSSSINSIGGMRYSDWIKVIEEASELGCQACQLIGGEPLLYQGEDGQTAFDLAEHARGLGYKTVEIFTNGTLLTAGKIKRIKKMGAKVAISLYSDDPQVHDRITQTPGSHAKTVVALKRLRDEGVQTRLETVVMKENQETIESTMAYRNRLGFRGKSPDPIRPSGRGNDLTHQPDDFYLIRYGYKLSPVFKASPAKVKDYQSGHPCLRGKIVITESGDILPCIFSRDQVIGNYLDCRNLSEVISHQALRQIWHVTKDDILVCRDCEYRYVCFDCRALAQAGKDGVTFTNAPNPRCTYNPYTGQWGEGVWKVEPQGKPYYDTRLAANIQKVRQAMQQSARF
jgi:radical SAM protein with 4Fe4S-binding SPASM domain